MDEVLGLRQRIDEIDRDIVRLLKSRYENARLLGQIKSARGLSIRDPRRERLILEEVDETSKALGLEPSLIRPIFKQIFTFAIEAQKDHPKTYPNGLEGLQVLVVGGTRGMGRFFARFARLQGGNVSIVGRDTRRTLRVAREMEVQPASLSDAGKSDIVILGVPMEATRKTAERVGPKMKAGSFLTDLSSVKSGIAEAVAARIPSEVEFVSIHPLFSPEVDHLRNQTIVVFPFKTGPMWKRFSRTLQNEGARLQTSSVKAHDRTMAYVQVLHHFALISLGVGLTKWNGTLQTNSLQATELRIRSVLRNWRTIAGIQLLNPYAPAARHEFVSAARRLERMSYSDERACRRMLTTNVQKWSRKI